MRREVFRAQGVTVSTGQGTVLQNITLPLYEKEILGVYDAYSDGKQALVALVEGRIRPTEGTLFFHGVPRTQGGAASCARIYRVSGHETLNDSLSLWENLLLRAGRSGFRVATPRFMQRYLSVLLREYEMELSPEQALGSLSAMDHFMLELLKARIEKAEIAVVPNFNLEGSAEQTEQLARLMRRLADEGMSILLTSHRLELLRRYTDRIAVLSNGMMVKTAAAQELNGSLTQSAPAAPDSGQAPDAPDRPVLYTVPELPLDHASGPPLTLHAGELVEILDLTGAAVQRLRACSGKDVLFLDAPIIDLAIEELSPADNLCLGMMERVSRRGVLRRRPQELILREFAQWHGNDEVLWRENCVGLSRMDMIAMVLFRLRLRQPKVLFCVDVCRELNPVSRSIMMEVVQELLEAGSAVCLVDTNDSHYERSGDLVFAADRRGVLRRCERGSGT